MGAVLNTETLVVLPRSHTPDFQPPTWQAISKARALEINATIPHRYRKLGGVDVVEMSQPEKDVVDAAEKSARIDQEEVRLDRKDIRAGFEVLLDGLNVERARHGASEISWAQFKTQWRTKRESL